MDTVMLARMQFGLTTIYHFFFVPLSIGLSFLVAVMETRYVRTGNEVYKKMAQFWGRLFLINAGVGIVTGIVQEFQFGMSWSEYSRFVGDIFGTPLAIETLLAFFLESTFLGIWIFGWDKLNKYVHLACMWLVVFGSLMSAFWIIVANSFMQHPEGYAINNGRAELSDFSAVLGNSNVWVQFPHVLMGALVMGSFFVLGVSAFNLFRKRGDFEFFRRSINLAVLVAVIATLGAAAAGDRQGEFDAKENPMKLAAMEGLWHTENGAGWSLISIIDEQNHKNLFELKIPFALSIMAFKDPFHEVKGIDELQAAAEARYGPGNYTPPVNVLFFAFRGMVGAAGLMIMLAFLGLFLAWKRRLATTRWYLFIASFGVFLPYISNTCGWLIAEMGRQPWVVNGVLKTEQAVSPNLTAVDLLISLSIFAVLYIGLAVADIFLMTKFANGNRVADFDPHPETAEETDEKLLVGAY